MHSPIFEILRGGKGSRKQGEGATWEDDGDLRGNSVLDTKWKVFRKGETNQLCHMTDNWPWI